ncbi:MAG: RdgB/HAM1 family non-canonical purine NTP pyrophosphatase [Bacilli bacterium]|nr:RdgB/HAM1 family non-canonical purine NTP pyrophosphatase [Bacilli bacterium]
MKILLATSNKHKLKEVRDILSKYDIEILGMDDLSIPSIDVIEDGKNYYENALIKASSLIPYTSLPIMADDTGLEILSLDNKPGLYTARFMEQFSSREETFKEIFSLLENKNRESRFICDIVLVNLKEEPLEFVGICEGKIATQISGDDGFGYDPIFIVKEKQKTFAEMTEKEKNAVSHRGKALTKLANYLKDNKYI